MRKNLLTFGLLSAFILAVFNIQAETLMPAEYTVGNAMGQADGEVTRKVINFYDSENRIIRGVRLATGLSNDGFASGDFFVEYVYYYDYNELGQLEKYYSMQYRTAYEDWVKKEETTYTYDENGNLIDEFMGAKGYRYEYDENGRVVHKEYYTTMSEPPVIQEIDYIEFDENGNPTKYNSNGDSSYKYDGDFEYDEQGRVVVENQYSIVSGAIKKRFTYTYDEAGQCIYEVQYKAGSSKPDTVVAGSEADTLKYSTCAELEAISNGWYAKRTWSWYKSAGWTKAATQYRQLYVDLRGEYAPLNIKAEDVSTTASPNTVQITCDVPAQLPSENVKYIIWRSGLNVAVVSAVDGKISFTDSGVENGTYDYIVQTYDETNDIYYNASDIAPVEVTVPLGAATNLRIEGGRTGMYEDPQVGNYETFFVKLAWDVEECAAPILGYRVWLYPWAYAMVEIDGDTRSCEISMPDEEVGNFRVDVIYEHGIKEGVYETLFWDNSEDFTGEFIPKYYLTKEMAYGDHMGSSAAASSVKYYIYDDANNLSRAIQYGYGTTGASEPMYHYFYEYNAQNLLVSEFYRQYTAVLGEWGKNKMTYVYTYNAQNQLVSKEDTTSHTLYEYAYDADGNLSTINETKRNYGSTEYDKPISTTTYSQYDANGNPGYAEYVHAIYASSSYNTTYTYDEKGNLLSEVMLYPDGTFYDKYEYEYDKYGVVLCRTRFSDETTGRSRIVRAPQGNAMYKRYDETYNATQEKWTTNGRFTMETYSALNGDLTPQNLTVTDASTAEHPNALKVKCNFPKVKLANAQYIVWRGWVPVDTVYATAHDGWIEFIDTDIENGEYEYIVQTYDVVTQQPFNATAPVLMSMDIELPAVTNLRHIKTEEGTEYDFDLGTNINVYWVHFEWDAPNTDLDVVRYNIYQDTFTLPVSTTTATSDSISVYRYDIANIDKQQLNTTITVSVVYEYGESEGVAEVFPVASSGVEGVEVSTLAYVAGKYLVVDANADVVVYNVAGATIANYNKQQRIDLTALPAGVYVAVVEVNGARQVVKIAR